MQILKHFAMGARALRASASLWSRERTTHAHDPVCDHTGIRAISLSHDQLANVHDRWMCEFRACADSLQYAVYVPLGPAAADISAASVKREWCTFCIT